MENEQRHPLIDVAATGRCRMTVHVSPLQLPRHRPGQITAARLVMQPSRKSTWMASCSKTGFHLKTLRSSVDGRAPARFSSVKRIFMNSPTVGAPRSVISGPCRIPARSMGSGRIVRRFSGCHGSRSLLSLRRPRHRWVHSNSGLLLRNRRTQAHLRPRQQSRSDSAFVDAGSRRSAVPH